MLLPAGVIDAVDSDDRCVYVQRTKDEIKNAPEFDPDRRRDSDYRRQFGSYYDIRGSGYYEGTRQYARQPAGARRVVRTGREQTKGAR